MLLSEIKELPLDQKLSLMEVLWEDLRSHYEEQVVSGELAALLRLRRERLQSGETETDDWDTVKFQIGRA